MTNVYYALEVHEEQIISFYLVGILRFELVPDVVYCSNFIRNDVNDRAKLIQIAYSLINNAIFINKFHINIRIILLYLFFS
jgi:hypothetical protein